MLQKSLRHILLASVMAGAIIPAAAIGAQQVLGELFYGEQPSIGDFDPYSQPANDGPTDRFLALIYEPLFRWNYNKEVLEPVLGVKATRTTPTAKLAKSAFFVDIKPNVRWHNGELFTAKDVEFTFAYMMSPECLNAAARTRANELFVSVKQVTPTRVLFEFKKDVDEPELYLNQLIVPISRFVWPSMRPLNPAQPLKNYAVGTGPYMQVGQPKRDPELRVNKNYHGSVGKLQAVSSRVQNDITTMVEGFLSLSGELNLLVEVPESRLKLVESKRQTVTTRALTAYNVYAVALRQNRGGPLVTGRARRAIAMAIDREQMRANWFMGRGRVLPGPFTPGSPFWDENLDPLPTDTAKAKAEFRALGLGARPLKLIYKSGDGGGETLDSDIAKSVTGCTDCRGVASDIHA